jgi:hypothetical protein
MLLRVREKYLDFYLVRFTFGENYFMEPVISNEGYEILQNPLKSQALMCYYLRSIGRTPNYWDGKKVDVDALMAEAFPEGAIKLSIL